MALEALGGKCIFASEIYAPSKSVYEKNLDTSYMMLHNDNDNKNLPHHHHQVSGDIWDVPSDNISKHDMLVTGFPCQPFSSLGDQTGLKDLKHVLGRKKGLVSDSSGDAAGAGEHIFHSGSSSGDVGGDVGGGGGRG